MLNRILVPVDFSAASRNAFRHAVELAEKTAASVELLNVIPPRSSLKKREDVALGRHIKSADAELVHEAERQLVSFVSSVPHEGVSVRYWVDPGDPAGSIVQEATDERFDLIVMGTHGRTGMSALILGSVAQSVVSCAPCPVMLVRG